MWIGLSSQSHLRFGFDSNSRPSSSALPLQAPTGEGKGASSGESLSVQTLDTCQNQISEQLLGTEDAVQEYLDDMEDAENYRDRYIEMCTRVDLKIRETVVPTETEKRSFKLPKIELKKFSGEAKDFLAF
ncbi:uncharacterized protein TNCV_1325301 [Trichonephila clavipes]|nr:uncharacterized protein TNCV_1325301 [Trichonephila clavipes]